MPNKCQKGLYNSVFLWYDVFGGNWAFYKRIKICLIVSNANSNNRFIKISIYGGCVHNGTESSICRDSAS